LGERRRDEESGKTWDRKGQERKGRDKKVEKI
jgi:hypothetical protein